MVGVVVGVAVVVGVVMKPKDTVPWHERVNTFVINPDSASRDDVVRMASEHGLMTTLISSLRDFLNGLGAPAKPVKGNKIKLSPKPKGSNPNDQQIFRDRIN